MSKTETQLEQAELLELLSQHTGDNGQIMVRVDGTAWFFGLMHSPKFIKNSQVAEASGVSLSTISHLETQPVSLKTAKRIADTMDMKISDLFFLASSVEA
ncbi:helix-turn-helix transcriptional regulator [Lacticaseibacillus sp. N501-2]|jgi:DNA-binding XRE family transcriptional regulator|uniref:helix-turn-helix transcriptional regulator n=1 Tax=Lacticaseibacillus salsurae TaxID=3367729 RepID=UPI0038B3C1F7